MSDTDYDAWSRDIEAGNGEVDPDSIIRAEDDPDGGLRLLLDATGAGTYDEALRGTLCRPRLGGGRS